jgi:predicted metal-dependent peptidase
MADKGTNVELAPTKTVGEAEAQAFKLDPHLINLMWNEPFFSKVLRPITKIRTDKIPTAGVLAKEGSIRMWWNPEFVAGLTTNQVKGLLKHECYHLVFGHTTTRRMTPHIVHNYATDLAINSMIPEEELPEGGLIPGKAFKELTEEDKATMGEKRVKQYEALSAKIASFPKEMASEWYFAELMKDDEVKDALTNPGGNGEGEGEGEGQGEGGGEGTPGKPGKGPGFPGPMDDHEGWDDLSDEDRELVKGKIKKVVEDAVRECDQSGSWGSVSGEARNKLRELISKEIPWQSVLKQFCGMTRRADRSSSIRRLNRKYTGIHPGSKRNHTSSIAVYIDQSGSVGNDSLELLFGELRSLARNVEFTVFHFDTEVDEDSETVWKKSRTPETHRTRCGGTCFKAPTEHANKNKKRFDGYLILTDGEAGDPGPSKLKRGWVIIPGRELIFSASKRDFVIQMKGGKSSD